MILTDYDYELINQAKSELKDHAYTVKKWVQHWDDSSLGFDVGDVMHIPCQSDCLVVIGKSSHHCIVFHGGKRAYRIYLTPWVASRINNQNLPGKKLFFDML